ncbi:MAG: AfsR/SARP family transcriptional regulator [Candidatus Eiseniibacteriota bacterium]
MSRVSLRLLGGTEARSATGAPLRLGTKKTFALLAFLAIHAGRPQRRDKLMTLLWGDRPDVQARQSLRQALWQIRGALGSAGDGDGPTGSGPLLQVDVDVIALDPAAVDVDVVEFERLAAEGSPRSLGHASDFYRGDLMEGLVLPDTGFDEWLRTERDRLRELAVENLARLLGLQFQEGEDEAAVQTALRLLALDPLQEAVHRTLIRLHRRQGRRGAALR